MKLTNWIAAPAGAALLVIILAGCSDYPARAEAKADSVDRLKRGTSETLSAAGAIAAETKDQAHKRLEREFQKLEVNMDDLKARMARAGTDAKTRIQEQLPDLERRKEELAHKLDDLKSRSGQAWDDMATGTEAAMRELRKSFEKAKSRFE